MKNLTAVFTFLLLALGAVDYAVAQDHDLDVTIPYYAEYDVASSPLAFSFTPGPYSGGQSLTASSSNTVSFATNGAQDHTLSVAISAAGANDWDDVLVDMEPSGLTANNVATQGGVEVGSVGTIGAAQEDLAANSSGLTVVSGASLVDGQVTVTWTVTVESVTRHNEDGQLGGAARGFEVAYTFSE